MGENDEALIWGAAAIGEAINRTSRQTWHLLSIGALPAWKIGGQWVTTRKALREAMRPAPRPGGRPPPT